MPTGKTITEELIDEVRSLMTERIKQGWDTYWRSCMRYALPTDASFDVLLNRGSLSSVTASISHTTAYRETKTLYDQTSLWAIERLTAGLVSLKTPESTNWHGLNVDDPFGNDASISEESWFDRVSRYLFKVRGNPMSGFWPTHKAAVRSTCAMGDGFFFIEEKLGNARVPYTYEFVPLGECYQTVDLKSQTQRFYRVRGMTAEQAAKRWGKKLSKRILDMANDPLTRQNTVTIVHAVVPRADAARAGVFGVMGAKWASYYIDMDDSLMIEQSGFWEMPYIQHSWGVKTPSRSYSEGPLALALAEIKSLNEMSKNELISSQQAVRPPLATYGDNFTRINLNAGKINKGLVSGDGKMLVQPIMTHTRPDFAQAVLETRRNNVREMLYLNLWQILIDQPQQTATQALLRAQEKGDLLGPVGISFNHSLASMVDREMAILGRKGAFEQGAPLEAPEELADADVAPIFTAPLDRMRNMEEVLGAQRTVAGMMEVAAFNPKIMDKLNTDEYAEMLRKGNGAPADLFYDDDQMAANSASEDEMAQLRQQLELAQQGGDAATAMGSGMRAMQDAGVPMPGVVNRGPSDAVTAALAA